MTDQPATVSDDLMTLPKLPAWVTSKHAETPETVAFRSGAALTILDQLVSDRDSWRAVKAARQPACADSCDADFKTRRADGEGGGYPRCLPSVAIR